MKSKQKILLTLILCVIIIGSIIVIKSTYLNNRFDFSAKCLFQNENGIVQKINSINDHTDYRIVEKNISNIPSGGTNVKFYYDKNNNLTFIDINSFATIARYFSRYYLDNNNIYFIDSVTDEWDLKQLYGENGELTTSEGKYAVSTSTREQYFVSNNKLCKYVAEKPRAESVAVTKSDPKKDFQGFLDMYQFIVEAK